MGISEYEKKRNFNKTREPKNSRSSKKIAKKAPLFVVQEHHASHLHYDFRLEAFGTLKSWAVPKGPSLVPGEKRLAVEVEDHPIAYAKFKGIIPKGEYGAGTVKIWDNGTWIPPEHIKNSLLKGRLEFELKGKKLKAKWLLVRTKKDSGKNHQWLLIKRHDEDSWPNEIGPQLASLSKNPPKGADWFHEIKLDGYRTLAFIKNTNKDKKIQLKTRSGLDWTDHYSSIALNLKKLEVTNAIIDGEIVVLDKKGHSNFSALQEAIKTHNFKKMTYIVFDILFLNGRDLRQETLESRKQILKETLKSNELNIKKDKIIFSEHVQGLGDELLKEACKRELEGIVSKDRTRPYHEGRSSDWQKIKCSNRQEMVIGAYTDPQGEREGFGALLLGIYENKELRYVGRVGTGFNAEILKELMIKFKKIPSKTSPFDVNSPPPKGVHWLKPKLVGEIEFIAWTKDHILRHASFKGLRDDKSPREINFESPEVNTDFRLTHPERVIYPSDKITKLDVANYYRSVAPWLMKHILDRPLSFVRCPEGAGKSCFYQKHVTSSGLSEAQENIMQNQKVTSINSVEGLLQLIQWGVLELHTWQGRVSKPLYPDQIIFDLDPGENVSWKEVIQTAERLKDLLNRLDLKSFVKTTGGKGLHVHVPIAPKYDWNDVKTFSKSISKQLEIDFPELYTTNISKKKRMGKIFLDYLRNGAGATAVAPYSLRSKPHPFVALPLKWSELKTLKSPTAFDLGKTLKRLASQKKDPWEDYFKLKQKIKILETIKNKK